MSLQWKWWDGWIWDRHWSGAKWWTERGIWGKRREIQGFSLEPVMMTLFSMVTLPFTVELTFLFLFWETFSLRLSGQGHQWCHKEIPVGDVNLATCLHLGLTWLQLMTPQGWRIILCSTPTPGVNLVLFSRALDYQSTFNQQKHHKYCSFSKLWLSRHLFFLIDLEIQECGEWIN